uniref:Uncharacterized protein n=1 Tax=viral metagenome TaxID=1070528 RepID=A0A6M3M0M4_9ZZZZ
MIQTQRITDHRGRTLIIERDIIPVYSNPKCPLATVVDEAYLVGHVCYGQFATIDGEPANKRRVGQFLRRAREAAEKTGGEA